MKKYPLYPKKQEANMLQVPNSIVKLPEEFLDQVLTVIKTAGIKRNSYYLLNANMGFEVEVPSIYTMRLQQILAYLNANNFNLIMIQC